MGRMEKFVGVLWLLLCCTILHGIALGQAERTQYEKLTQDGRKVYRTYCVGCHGVRGDGNGPAARFLNPKPRDFTKGIFKFRTTPSGSLPKDEDLYKTITRGLHRTAMPQFSLLSEHKRLALVAYIKTFSKLWQRRTPEPAIYLPDPPRWLGSPESAKRGKEVYTLLGCYNCHGETGKGDGSSAATLEPDAWGHHQKPFDFTKGTLKSGPTVKDIYRTFMTGLNGTAMPSYADFFMEPPENSPIKKDDIWNLISFILSLRGSGIATGQK
ncbi:MAG: c-type cytochrome [bacterium]